MSLAVLQRNAWIQPGVHVLKLDCWSWQGLGPSGELRYYSSRMYHLRYMMRRADFTLSLPDPPHLCPPRVNLYVIYFPPPVLSNLWAFY